MGFLWLFARRFVAGQTLAEAIPKIKEMNAKGIMVTLDILGENVTNKEEPERFLDGYIEVLDAISREGVNGGISIKPTMMGMDIDIDACRANLERILDAAKKNDIFVRIDMEGTNYTQRTIDLVIDLHKRYPGMGAVIQAYLHRSAGDVRRLIGEGISVRLCKGAYREPPELAIKKMADIRANYIELAKLLLADSGARHAIATHDEQIIDWTKQWTAERGIAPERFEFQMLYGMRPQLQERLAAEGYLFRTYVPFGSHWFPYFYRRLRERKENIWFVLKNLFRK